MKAGIITRQAVDWLEFSKKKGPMQLVKSNTRGNHVVDLVWTNLVCPRGIEIQANLFFTDHSTVCMDYMISKNEEEWDDVVNPCSTKIPEENHEGLTDAQWRDFNRKLVELN